MSFTNFDADRFTFGAAVGSFALVDALIGGAIAGARDAAEILAHQRYAAYMAAEQSRIEEAEQADLIAAERLAYAERVCLFMRMSLQSGKSDGHQ
jgi:Cys-tRNA synthase (O-phospho-L-seryl-tRNA:Cys-tRNA synthase)